MATQLSSIRRHLRGEHSRWCSTRKRGVIVCKYTGRPIKQVSA
jgi:hypothetical protein